MVCGKGLWIHTDETMDAGWSKQKKTYFFKTHGFSNTSDLCLFCILVGSALSNPPLPQLISARSTAKAHPRLGTLLQSSSSVPFCPFLLFRNVRSILEGITRFCPCLRRPLPVSGVIFRTHFLSSTSNVLTCSSVSLATCEADWSVERLLRGLRSRHLVATRLVLVGHRHCLRA